MCGINGLFFGNGTQMDFEAVNTLVQCMNNRIAHRGPNDEGTWSDNSGRTFFGHRRLSIIDLSAAGHQPFTGESGNALTYNGEIYDYKKIRQKHLFNTSLRSNSDTEVLFELLSREDEVSALDKIDGMFAFAFWNQAKQHLFLARDQVGKKPLYYTGDSNRFAFSSEIKALLELPWVNPQPDTEALYHFLTYNQLPAPFTLFNGIFKLGPGEWMRVSKNGIETGTYWKPAPDRDSNTNSEAYMDQILFELEGAVQRRMVSDVPVGAFLSGGVDSSAIVAYMKKLSGSSVKTYSIGFDGAPGYDERNAAAETAKRLSTEHHEFIISKHHLTTELSSIIASFDEPLADPTAIPIHFLSKMARENGTQVVLTGDGADELFAGYSAWGRYARYAGVYEFMLHLPQSIRSLNDSVCNRMFPSGSSIREFAHRINKGQSMYWGGARALKEHFKGSLLSKSFQSKCSNLDSYGIIQSLESEFEIAYSNHASRDFVNKMSYIGLRFQIPCKYLYRMDRLGMAHAVEVRNPFLDKRMVGLALSIPGKFKYRNGTSKWILKKSLEGILPHETLYRKKMGFCMPIREWAGELLIDSIDSSIDQFSNTYDVFDADAVKHMLVRFRKGDIALTNTVWTIYFLINWFERWIKKE